MFEKNRVKMVRRRNARHVIVRRGSDGTYQATVPARMKDDEAERIIFDLIRRIEASHPDEWKPKFHDNQLNLDGMVAFHVMRQGLKPDDVIGYMVGKRFIVGVGYNLEWGTRETDLAINRVILARGRQLAKERLIAFAEEIADLVGVYPKGWKIGYGKRILGTCNASGTITLSYMLMFLTAGLAAYVICHELAHLSEMNHSARFHEVCDRYCHGNEKLMAAELRRYKWPVIR